MASNVLQVRSPARPGLTQFAPVVSQQPPLVECSGRRARIWEISPSLHCSVVGTCLSAVELRQLLVKFGDADTRTASDHALHKRGVLAAGRQDKLGKALQKLLDGKHEAAIRQFAKAASAEDVRAQWMRAFDQGAIPGGYWAMITHPATNRALVEEAFGQIHMLSHMIGSSNRADVRRLRELERDLAERDDKIARQQARLAESASERSDLRRDLDRLSAELRKGAASSASVAQDVTTQDVGVLLRRIDTEKERTMRLVAQVERLESQLAEARREAGDTEERRRRLEQELASLENILTPSSHEGRHDRAKNISGLRDLTVLYVGGRPGLVAQLKNLCAENGAHLLAHDGGVEDSLASLPGFTSRADLVVFPVDCVSHSAVGIIRKVCRDSARECIPLRTASVASFVDAIARNAASSLHSAGCC